MSVQAWNDCVALLPRGWRLSSDMERRGYRVRARDAAGEVWVSRWAATFEEAVSTVTADLRTMPQWLRDAA